MAPGKAALFRYRIENRLPKPRHVRAYYQFNRSGELRPLKDLVVPAQGHETAEERLVPVPATTGFWIHLFEDGGTPRALPSGLKPPAEAGAYQATDGKGFRPFLRRRLSR